MKKKLVLAAHLLYLLNIPLLSQWENVNPVPYGNDLNDVFFVKDEVGWIVGTGGFILKTTNTGLKWTHLESGTDSLLNDVFFIDENTGWVVGNGGTVLQSINGGTSWSEQVSGIITNLNSVYFIDENKGWIVGENGIIIKTTNGGSTWETLNSGTNENLLSLVFISETKGFVVGGNYYDSGIKLTTTDGGLNWNIDIHDYSMNTVFFLNSTIGWISGQKRVYKTTDGGENWFVIVESPGNYIDYHGNIVFTDENNGYMSYSKDGAPLGNGCGKILRSVDGGYNWSGGDDICGYNLSGLGSIFMSSTGKGITIGLWGQIIITEDFGDTWKVLVSGGLWETNYISIYDLAILNDNIKYAIGSLENHVYVSNKAILKPVEDSNYWVFERDLGGSDRYNGTIMFINDSVGYALNFCTIYRTTNSGISWEEFYTSPDCDSPIPENLLLNDSDLFFSDINHGWLKTFEHLHITTDGGYNWSSSPMYDLSNSVLYFIDNLIGFIAGGGGVHTINKTTDGGINWTNVFESSTSLTSILFINDDIGFTTGEDGLILKSTDTGETWQQQNSGTLEDLNDLYFINDNYGYVVGNNGIILATSNAGYSWHLQESGTINDLYTIMFMDNEIGYIGGSNGTLLQTTNGGGTIPVELTSFTAASLLGKVTLNWQTATETNNLGFEIERKIISEDKEDNWLRIGFKEGHGTTTEPQSYSFIDDINALNSVTIKYRLKQIDYDGSYEYSNVVEVTNLSPAEFVLQQNYPNPFNPSTVIKFGLPIKSNVQLNIYNTVGEKVAQLIDEVKPAGNYEIEFDAANLPSGIYFYQLRAGSFIQTKKMLMIK